MKKVLFAALISLLVLGCQKPEEKSQTSETKKAGIVSTEIAVNTVKCDMCVTTITNALNAVSGVKSASVDLEKKIARVEYASADVSLSQLESAISKAGYDANSTKRDEAVYQNLPKCCQ